MTERFRTPDLTSAPITTSSDGRSATTATSSGFRDALRDAARSIASGEATIDGAVERLSRGRSMSPEELIALQATVYRHAAEVEMAAKLVDKLTGAVRTALTSQQ